MPVLVIHSLGKPPQKASWDQREIRVGRDPNHNHLVLPGPTVSREHAVFRAGPDGRWSVACASQTNPIVVNGVLTEAEVFVGEGSEVLVGSEYLLVFAESEVKAKQYLGVVGHFAPSECARCHWSGMVSSLRRQPVCPKCGGTDLRGATEYRRDSASRLATSEETATVDPRVVRAELERLRAAKRSAIERVDGLEPGTPRKPLAEGEPFMLGKDPQAHFHLGGLVIGQGVRVVWDGRRWVAQAFLFWPKMKVNGRRGDLLPLTTGDVIEVGRNRFRFVVE